MDGPAQAPARGGSFDAPLWRALAAFRIATLAYALILIAHNQHTYRHPVAAWVVGAVLVAWTGTVVVGYARLRGTRRRPLLLADLLVMGGCLLSSVPIIGVGPLTGKLTLPSISVAGVVIAWAIAEGRRAGMLAAVLIGAADLSTRGVVDENTLNNTVLLFLAAFAVGHISRLGVVAQERLERAARLEATTRARERLAREIHDNVLQVLAFIARRARELDGDAADLGRLASEQEAVLRRMIGASGGASAGDGLADVRAALDGFASTTVTVAAPATVVGLPARVTDELVAAVGSALADVAAHAGPGARAWVLLEEDGDAVTVTVRDDGASRPDDAAAAGLPDVARSIGGRLRDLGGRLRELGGTASVTTRPGRGTEVELRVPRPR